MQHLQCTTIVHLARKRRFKLLIPFVLCLLALKLLVFQIPTNFDVPDVHVPMPVPVHDATSPPHAQGQFEKVSACTEKCTDQQEKLCMATRVKCLMAAFPYKSAENTVAPISDVWWGAPLDKFPGSDIALPSMISEGDCIIYLLLGATIGESSSTSDQHIAVVEMGTWLGAASVCTAAGMALLNSEAHYHAFDFFKFKNEKDGNFKKLYLKGADSSPAIADLIRSKDHNYERIWNQVVTTVYPQKIVHSHPGSIGTQVAVTSAEWDNARVGLFTIDSAKDYDNLVLQSHAVWASFRPGSVVVFADFLYPIHCGKASRPSVPAFVYSELVQTGLFRLLWIFPSTSAVAFEVTEKYNYNHAKDYLNSYHSASDWEGLLDQLTKEIELHMSGRGYDEKIILDRKERAKTLFACDIKMAQSPKV